MTVNASQRQCRMIVSPWAHRAVEPAVGEDGQPAGAQRAEQEVVRVGAGLVAADQVLADLPAAPDPEHWVWGIFVGKSDSTPMHTS